MKGTHRQGNRSGIASAGWGAADWRLRFGPAFAAAANREAQPAFQWRYRGPGEIPELEGNGEYNQHPVCPWIACYVAYACDVSHAHQLVVWIHRNRSSFPRGWALQFAFGTWSAIGPIHARRTVGCDV